MPYDIPHPCGSPHPSPAYAVQLSSRPAAPPRHDGRVVERPGGRAGRAIVLESLGPLTGSPWIYAVVALSVLLD
ncbi:hypothetical protein EAO77_35810, partial [Streptomyces sp. t39]